MSHKTKITTAAASVVAALAIVMAAVWPGATAALAAHTTAPSAAAHTGVAAPARDVLPMPGSPSLAGHAVPNASPGAVHPHGQLTPSQCVKLLGTSCDPGYMLRKVYGTYTLNHKGITGAGYPIAVVMAFQDPVILHDLQAFSVANHIKPPHLTILKFGHPKVADPKNAEQAVSAEEETFDLSMAHLMAPGAPLVLIETQQDVALTPAAFTNALRAVQWAASKTRISVLTMSYGFFGQNYVEAANGNLAKARALVMQQHALVKSLVARGMTIVSGDGDTGPTGPNLTGAGTGLYPVRTTANLAFDPDVTGVSGTTVPLNDQGKPTSPVTAWSNTQGFATGGGLSDFFGRPAFQNQVRGIVGNHRGVPDVSMLGSVLTGPEFDSSLYNVLGGQQPGWVVAGGTSGSGPLFAGVVADADQLAGRQLGNINPALYKTRAGTFDVSKGCNTIPGGPVGYCSRPGYDLVTGLGTVASPAFVPALVKAAHTR